MKKKGLFILLAILAVVVIFYCYHWYKERGPKPLILYGNVDIRQADLGFRVYGKVKTLFVDEGDLVEKGTLMAELDPVPYKEALDQAQAKREAVLRRLENARLVYSRRDELIKSGAVSQENLTDTFSEQQVLTAELAQAEAEYAQSLTNLNDTKLFAPEVGTILTRIREPGSVVVVGQPVFTLSILSPVWIRAYVQEPELGRVRPGMIAEITTDTPEFPTWKGRVGFISPVAEFTPKAVETTSLRTDLVYRIRVMVDNPGWKLKQGMPVTVKLQEDNHEPDRN
jgi:HlyD family secretion protein